jgi:hypothetical protein
MKSPNKRYLDNTVGFPSAGLIIRQKEAKLEAPFDRIRCMRAITRLRPGAKITSRCIAYEVCRWSYRDAIPPAPGGAAGAP